MRVLSSLIAASTLMAAAAPSHAQDFLGGLARSVGSQAAQALVNRAVTAATSGAPASDPATPSGAPAGPGRAANGLLYDDQGDLVYEAKAASTAWFDGKAHWRNAAYCVALSDLVDIDVAERRALAEQGGHAYSGPTVEAARAARKEGQDARWRAFGVRRLRIDHPERRDQETAFDAETARQIPLLREQDWSGRFAWRNMEGLCNSLFLQLGSLNQNMANGRGLGS